MSMLSHYLNVSRDKLVSKGVESVRSRVINLTEYDSGLNIDIMKDKLIEAFRKVYAHEPERLDPSQMDTGELNRLEQKFSSWDWLYGGKMDFNYSLGKRFPWGDIDIKLNMEAGVIKDCIVYSDSLETELIEKLPEVLHGCLFASNAMEKALIRLEASDASEVMIKDIIELIHEESI
jgi:lipoate-protein ligase A